MSFAFAKVPCGCDKYLAGSSYEHGKQAWDGSRPMRGRLMVS